MGEPLAPPLIKLSILYEKNEKYIQKHTKNMQIHINICKNVEKYIKKNSSNQESEKIKTGPPWGAPHSYRQLPGYFVYKKIHIYSL